MYILSYFNQNQSWIMETNKTNKHNYDLFLFIICLPHTFMLPSFQIMICSVESLFAQWI